MPRLLDLFCGRWGWSRSFAARGWECVGVDLTEPPEIPNGCTFLKEDVLSFEASGNGSGWIMLQDEFACHWSERFDFIVASSPCEEFSVHGMKHFHPNPKYPETGIRLFNHTRELCEASGLPYAMENVRPAQRFVGNAVHHCGPFYLWGNGVPPLLHRGIVKGANLKGKIYHDLKVGRISREQFLELRKPIQNQWGSHGSVKRAERTSVIATIPPELANCVADYAERLIEQRMRA